MKWLRRALLEWWAMLLTAAIVGFLGPFGSYQAGDYLSRVWRWSLMLMGAYVMIRPVMIASRWMEIATRLPRGFLVLWGAMSFAFPMTLIWLRAAPAETRPLGGFEGLLPFSLLCAVLIIFVVSWAERADAHLRHYYADAVDGFSFARRLAQVGEDEAQAPPLPAARDVVTKPVAVQGGTRLNARLSRGFEGPVLALESEDHYVRVHGPRRSELLLIRMRDAIVEMDGIAGEQVHRSWWVAADAVKGVEAEGRNRKLVLANGMKVPVSRDSVARLRQIGFIP